MLAISVRETSVQRLPVGPDAKRGYAVRGALRGPSSSPNEGDSISATTET